MDSSVGKPAAEPPADAAEARREAVRRYMVDYGPALRRYFQRKVGADEVEDLLQDVYLKMQGRGVGAKENPENIEGYLFRTAANVLVTHFRRRSSQGWGRLDPLEDFPDPLDDVSPERVLIGRQAVDRVAEALEALPPRARQAFLLHRFEELTYPVIAARMGIGVKAVEALIARAMQRLGELVGERG
jgi:RNA polymerase sigma-70 factor (ECF subfamily)